MSTALWAHRGCAAGAGEHPLRRSNGWEGPDPERPSGYRPMREGRAGRSGSLYLSHFDISGKRQTTSRAEEAHELFWSWTSSPPPQWVPRALLRMVSLLPPHHALPFLLRQSSAQASAQASGCVPCPQQATLLLTSGPSSKLSTKIGFPMVSPELHSDPGL